MVVPAVVLAAARSGAGRSAAAADASSSADNAAATEAEIRPGLGQHRQRRPGEHCSHQSHAEALAAHRDRPRKQLLGLTGERQASGSSSKQNGRACSAERFHDLRDTGSNTGCGMAPGLSPGCFAATLAGPLLERSGNENR